MKVSVFWLPPSAQVVNKHNKANECSATCTLLCVNLTTKNRIELNQCKKKMKQKKIKVQRYCGDECNSNKIECYNIAYIAIKLNFWSFFLVDCLVCLLVSVSLAHSLICHRVFAIILPNLMPTNGNKVILNAPWKEHKKTLVRFDFVNDFSMNIIVLHIVSIGLQICFTFFLNFKPRLFGEMPKYSLHG